MKHFVQRFNDFGTLYYDCDLEDEDEFENRNKFYIYFDELRHILPLLIQLDSGLMINSILLAQTMVPWCKNNTRWQ